MGQDTPGSARYLVEKAQVFSRSLLWELQRRYFVEKGTDAWAGEVPHYITNNPVIAQSYAELAVALLLDHRRLFPGESHEPLYVCELGAGTGRFAFHFLQHLSRLCEEAGLAPTSFCYILTDLSPPNLDFWRHHPQFQPFFERHLLDIALFDITGSDQLALQFERRTIAAGSLASPLIVIANYVFDSIPQDLLYLDHQHAYQCLVSLFADVDPESLPASGLLDHLHCEYDYQALTETHYQEPLFHALLTMYQQTLTGAYLFFPAAGLRCLQRLQALSKQGLLVISADKGDHRLTTLQGPPKPNHHGSVSFGVNYHAYKAFCEQHHGLALFPVNHYHINVNCLVLLRDARAYRELQRAYRRHVQDFGPDDFYRITRSVGRNRANLSAEEILAYLRLSYYDSHQFARLFPRLMELVPTLSLNERQDVIDGVDNLWHYYFPLKEEPDLAYSLACLLYELDDYSHALRYFECSLERYGEHTSTLYNMALCYQLLEDPAKAIHLLRLVVQYDPEHQKARKILMSLSK